MLLNQQNKAIEKLHRLKVGALFMQPGTGKTLTAMKLIETCRDIETILWFTPCQTKQNLKTEIEKFNILKNVLICGIETISSSDRTYLEILNIVQSKKTFIVCDESLKIKNIDAKRTQRLIIIASHCEYRLVLNGTPITRNILDVWAQIHFLSPKILNMGIAEYKNTFCEWVEKTTRHNGKVRREEYIRKFHNIDYLYSLINPYIYECDLELTIEKNHIQKYYTLGESELESYQYFKEKYLDNEKLAFLNNNIFLEMTQKMQHEYCITENKFEILEEILKTSDLSKTIIYCKYIKSYNEVKERFPKANVLTYGKHAIGLNLQSNNITIYFDKTFDYAQMIQSEFRTFRTGQTENCIYYNLTGNVGLEKMINDNISKKQTLLDYFKKVGAKQIKEEL